MVFGNIFGKIKNTFGEVYDRAKDFTTNSLLPAIAGKASQEIANVAVENLKKRYLGDNKQQ